ncbi:MAG: DNA replication/repair protein RecF [Clostridia bacterium]|nr:DNA replication/repair protein RecF [Clostridia bacterium]
MLVKQLTAEHFRNLQTLCLQPCEGCNVIVGQNAQGKTNILEAIWLFTGSKSFRGAKDRELVELDRPEALLSMDFTAAGREQKAELHIDKGRSFTLNGIRLASPAKMAGHFCGIVFSPVHLQLVKDGPEARRRFLDAAYCQHRPGYVTVLGTYLRLLQQRNALLKDARFHRDLEGLLDVFSEKLAAAGAQVWAARQAYVRSLTPVAAEIYGGISAEKEKMTLQYRSSVALPPQEEQWQACFLQALADNREQDLACGSTGVGPHRDDLEIQIDAMPARTYASQGQQRSAVLALKLAEASLLQQTTKEKPVALLDDVMSELDPARQEYILNHILDWQVFITCCDPGPLLRMKSGQQFRIRQGRLLRE